MEVILLRLFLKGSLPAFWMLWRCGGWCLPDDSPGQPKAAPTGFDSPHRHHENNRSFIINLWEKLLVFSFPPDFSSRVWYNQEGKLSVF